MMTRLKILVTSSAIMTCGVLNTQMASAEVVGYNVKYTVTEDNVADAFDRVGEMFFGMVFVDPTVDVDPMFAGVQAEWNPADPGTSDARFMASYPAIGSDWDSDTDDLAVNATVLWIPPGEFGITELSMDGAIFDGPSIFDTVGLIHFAIESEFSIAINDPSETILYRGDVNVTEKVVPEPTTLALAGLCLVGIACVRRKRL
jgi:hypothetical protein